VGGVGWSSVAGGGGRTRDFGGNARRSRVERRSAAARWREFAHVDEVGAVRLVVRAGDVEVARDSRFHHDARGGRAGSRAARREVFHQSKSAPETLARNRSVGRRMARFARVCRPPHTLFAALADRIDDYTERRGTVGGLAPAAFGHRTRPRFDARGSRAPGPGEKRLAGGGARGTEKVRVRSRARRPRPPSFFV